VWAGRRRAPCCSTCGRWGQCPRGQARWSVLCATRGVNQPLGARRGVACTGAGASAKGRGSGDRAGRTPQPRVVNLRARRAVARAAGVGRVEVPVSVERAVRPRGLELGSSTEALAERSECAASAQRARSERAASAASACTPTRRGPHNTQARAVHSHTTTGTTRGAPTATLRSTRSTQHTPHQDGHGATQHNTQPRNNTQHTPNPPLSASTRATAQPQGTASCQGRG